MRTIDRKRALDAGMQAEDPFAAAASLASAVCADPDRGAAVLISRMVSVLGTREVGLFRVSISGVASPISGAATSEMTALASRIRTSPRPLVATTPDAVAAAGLAGANAVIAVPVRLRSRAVGALVAVSRHGGFEPHHARLVAFCADLAALVFERPTMESLDVLLTTGDKLAAVLESKQLLEKTLDGAQRLFAASGGFVCLVDEETGALRTALYRMLPRDAVEATLSNPAFASLTRETSPRVDTPGAHSPFGALADVSDAIVTIPLEAEGRCLGLVCTALRDVPAPDPTTLKIASALGHHAATTVRTTLLYESVSDREAQTAAIVASFPDPLVVADTDGTFVLVNPAAEQLFGLSNDFERGRPVRNRLPSGLDGLLLGDGDEHRDVHLGTPEPEHYAASASSVKSRDSRPIGRVLVLHNRTREEKAEQAHSDFVAVIGHELRTPLTVIKGFVRTLMRRGDELSADSVQEALRTINEQSLHLEHLIEDLLFLSQAEREGAKLHAEWGDLVAVVREFVERARQHQEQQPNPREIAFRSQTMEIPMALDRAKVEQALTHLLDNALKYSDDKIVVGMTRTDETAEVSVTDRGIGIYSGDVEDIFERFRQVDTSSTRETGGTGIGLYICRRLMEAHGGQISVESNLGRGSTFKISLPLDVPG